MVQKFPKNYFLKVIMKAKDVLYATVWSNISLKKFNWLKNKTLVTSIFVVRVLFASHVILHLLINKKVD